MTLGQVQVFKLAGQESQEAPGRGAIRRQDLATSASLWVGVAHTVAGEASPWHHHDGNETYGCVISGRLRLEFGLRGAESAEVAAGEAFHVGGNVVHREITLGSEPAVIFVTRVGSGKAVVNVDGPESG